MNQRCCIKCLSKEIIVLHVKMQPRLSVDFCLLYIIKTWHTRWNEIVVRYALASKCSQELPSCHKK